MAIGNVERLSSGASFSPTIPDRVITSIVPVWNNACEVKSRSTLLHLVFVDIKIKRYKKSPISSGKYGSF